MRVEHDDNQVGSLGKPLHDTFIIIVAPALLGAAQNARRVDNRHILQQGRIQLDSFQSRQEIVAIRTQTGKWPIRLTAQGSARNNLVLVSPQDGREAIRRWFGPNANARKITSQQILDKRSLANTVLAEQQNHGRRIKVRRRQWRRVKVAVPTGQFQG